MKLRNVVWCSHMKVALAAQGGIGEVTMETLRDAVWNRRLGKHVYDKITFALDCEGIDHRPKVLPRRQDGLVVLLLRNSVAARLVTGIEKQKIAEYRSVHKLISKSR